MRSTNHRYRHALLCLTVLAGAGLGGCDKLTPNGASGTLALLHTGSEQACVASEVQDDLRGLILPKPNELGTGVATEDATAAIGTVSVAFDATTLQAADKSVSKVSCSTNVRVEGSNGEANRFRLSYDVSPAAEDPNHVVVSAVTDDARTFARAQIATALEHQAESKAQQQQDAQANQARQQLLAMITPKWLVGLWIATDADAAQCSNGLAYAFRANHRVEGSTLNGRWVLTADQLHAIGEGMGGAAEIDGTITAADPLSFTLTSKEGAPLSLRRCSREEVQASNAPPPDSFAPSPLVQPGPN